jgi:tetratricopeptide (TPR) repeat protein
MKSSLYWIGRLSLGRGEPLAIAWATGVVSIKVSTVRVVSILALLTLAATAADQPAELTRCSIALDREDYASAARDAQSFLRLHPESVPARLLLARGYMGLNNGTAALSELHSALLREPGSIEALYYLSKLAAVMSVQEFGVVGRNAPDSARMHQIRAETLEAQKDAAGAEREYLVALEKRPGTAYIMNALGDLKRHEKQYAEALRWYEQVLARDPNNYDALYGAGASYHLLHQGDALPLLRRALKADPSSTAAKMAIGEVLLLRNNAAEALTFLEQAAKVDPNFRRLQFLLGHAYQLVGRKEDARLAFERSRALAAREDEEDRQSLGDK